MNLTVLFEDDSFLAVSKPSGLTVNTSDTTMGEQTLQDLVAEYLKIEPFEKKPRLERKEGEDYEALNRQAFYDRCGIVHRLDKETSGVLLVAKTPDAFIELLRQFRERLVKKKYIALVHGIVQPAVGEIRVPVGRQEWNRKRFGVVAGGREAVTKYETVGLYQQLNGNGKETLSLLELFPETGRTHQIRVHMKYVNHPLVSDELYGGRKTARNDRKLLTRLFLHASHISFAHPVTQESIELSCALSADLQSFIDIHTQKIVE